MLALVRAQVDRRDGALEEREDGRLERRGSPASVNTDRLCDASDE